MNRRVRLLGALLALVAFSAYFTESVVAAFCAPAGDHATQHAVSHAPAAGAEHVHADETDDSDAASPGTSHESGCPLGMSGTTCVAVSLPTIASSVQILPTAGEADFVRDQSGTTLLLIHTLYHPPRA
jgi:hypothetical protein